MSFKNIFANFIAIVALAATLNVYAAAHTAPVKSEIGIASLQASASAATIQQPTTCQQSQLAVALEAGQPTTYQVTGQLCYKPNNKNVVHLLVSGATYGSVYWDFPLQPQRYSYVRALTNAGYATFNF